MKFHSKIELYVNGLSQEEIDKYKEILYALIKCGGLSGVKDGRTIIHFDGNGNFQRIQLDYFPWHRRKKVIDS